MAESAPLHTDAHQQARFRALSPEDQMMEIWLNTRETNGHVAQAMHDIQELQRFRKGELMPWMDGVDKKLIVAGAMLTFVLMLVPTVLTLLNYIEWK